MTQPSTRVRLYKSRFVHAVLPDHRTSCHIPDITRDDPTWLPDTEPVTCPACKRALAREDTP